MRNENFAPYLLQPFPAPPLDEERELCLQISTPARRWNVARAVPFLLQFDEKRPPPPIEQGLSRGGGLCPLPRPARAFALNHASCPGYFLPCFSIFALPRRTLKGGQGGTIVGSPCFFRFLSSEKGRNKKKANFVLVQTQQETFPLLSTCKNVFLSKPKQKRILCPALP